MCLHLMPARILACTHAAHASELTPGPAPTPAPIPTARPPILIISRSHHRGSQAVHCKRQCGMQQGELRCGGSGGAAAGAARHALPGCAVTLLLQTRPLSLSVFLDDLAFIAVLQPSCFHCSMQPLLTIHLFPANMRLPTLAALVLPPPFPSCLSVQTLCERCGKYIGVCLQYKESHSVFGEKKQRQTVSGACTSSSADGGYVLSWLLATVRAQEQGWGQKRRAHEKLRTLDVCAAGACSASLSRDENQAALRCRQGRQW